ncbi:MAG TPA: ABC transporter permease [Candidatus Saccharimonadia bacterium]
MSALGVVFGFELRRTVTKPSFWIRTLAVPALIAAVIVLSYFSSKVSSDTTEQLKTSKFSVQVLDESRLVNPAVLAAVGARRAASKPAGVAAVQHGEVDAFIYYPQDLAGQPAEVYAADAGLVDNAKYQAMASSLVQASLSAKLGSPAEVKLLQAGVSTKLTTYKDGAETKGFGRVVAPGLFLVLFYAVIVLLGNQMLTSTTEEKENRVVEMILTSVSATHLIWGKIWALIVLGVIQVLAILVPVLVAYFGFRSQLKLPAFDLTQVSLAPGPILAGLALFVGGFMVFTAMLVAIGSAVPTAKEAGGYFGAAIIAMFIPFYALGAVATSPHQLIVQVLSFFPLSAPITLMLRNAVGNVSAAELLAGIAIIFVTGFVLMGVAVRTFRYGSLEYARKLGLKEIFTRRV